MSAVVFHEAAQQYAAAGIASLPLGGEDGKRPLVKHPQRFGVKAALEIAPKFPEANVGFWCGRRSNLTVVDIDSADEAELRWTQDTFGRSPIIVRTGSGKFHTWYRYNGERRRIRPIEGHDIDLLGEGGYCVAPPSVRPNGGKYEFLEGNLDRVADLPMIRPEALGYLRPRAGKVFEGAARGDSISEGTRNNTLSAIARSFAADALSKEALLSQLHQANADMNDPPLPDAEVLRIGASAWRYKLQGRLMVPGMASAILLPRDSINRLLAAGETDALAIMTMARETHGSGRDKAFALSPHGMAQARLIGSWGRNRYRDAIRKACELGELVQVKAGGRGPNDPALYRFAPAHKGSNPDPNINRHPLPLAPAHGSPESWNSARGEFCARSSS